MTGITEEVRSIDLEPCLRVILPYLRCDGVPQETDAKGNPAEGVEEEEKAEVNFFQFTPRGDELEELGMEMNEKHKIRGRCLFLSFGQLTETFDAFCDALPRNLVQLQHFGGTFCYVNGPVRRGTMLSSSPGSKQKLISGVYGSNRGNNSNQVFKMEHSASQGRNNQWNLEVKYKPRKNKTSTKRWVNVWNFYPDAKVELKHNEIELTISSPNEDHEFAVFGTPEINDEKRMQMGIFGGKPTQGKHWNIFVILFDDTMMAFKHVCEREESKGRQLLTTLAGLLVSNSDEDIKIDISALEDGWKIIGSNLMTIKSKDAWNSPENSTDFPCCVFEIAHVNETKQSFFCGIQASHLNDTAETELVAFFEQEQENEVTLTDQNFIAPPELIISEYNVIVSEAFVTLQILVFFVGCLAGSGFDPHPLKAEETDGNVLANGGG